MTIGVLAVAMEARTLSVTGMDGSEGMRVRRSLCRLMGAFRTPDYCTYCCPFLIIIKLRLRAIK